MVSIAEWIAPGATMIAAMMTAANLGARVTGWGFVVFTIGSIAWSALGIATGQQPLVITNGFLTVVNAVGIWRWLGRQAQFEDGSDNAAAHSASNDVPSLFSAAGLAGKKLVDQQGCTLGTLVDAMLECDGNRIAYVVVTDGEKAGLDETLRGVMPTRLEFGPSEVRFCGQPPDFHALPVLEKDNWPARLESK